MKRLFLIGAVLALSAPAFAQKANLRKISNKVEYGMPPAVYDLSNLNAETIQELRELSEPTLKDPETAGNHKAWQYACRLKVWDMNHLLKEYQANNNTFPDPAKFFQNQYDIVTLYEKYYDLLNTPNEKGKLPMKKEEMDKEVALAIQVAKGARSNLLIAASNMVYSDPEKTVQMLDLYYSSEDHPLFASLNLKEDPQRAMGFYIYAVALKKTGGDEAKYVEYLNKAMESDNGPLACQDLITYYKEKGDNEKVKKMYEMGVEKFPNQIIFIVNLMQNEFQAHNYDKTIEIAEQTIAKIEDGTISSTNEQGEKVETIKWPYYFKAVSLFNQQKYEEAYAAFEAASAVEDNFDNLSGAANCAAQLGQRLGGSNKAEGNKWYDKAIELYERCKNEYPDQSDVWGYQLYVCWNNKASLNNSQEMLKKAKSYEKYKGK